MLTNSSLSHFKYCVLFSAHEKIAHKRSGDAWPYVAVEDIRDNVISCPLTFTSLDENGNDKTDKGRVFVYRAIGLENNEVYPKPGVSFTVSKEEDNGLFSFASSKKNVSKRPPLSPKSRRY